MAHSSEIEKLERRWMDNPMGVTFAPLAEAYRRAGDQARALEVLGIGLAQHPAYVPALIVQARCHLDARADAPAEESFLSVLRSDPHNLIALKGLADICERTERLAEAQRHLDRLLEADPTHDEGRAQHVRVSALLAERQAILGSAPPAFAGAPAAAADEVKPEMVSPADFEPTSVAAEPDAGSVASLLDEGVSGQAEAAEEPPAPGEGLGLIIERETSPFGEFDGEDWAGITLSAVEAPDLPFDEGFVMPALADESDSPAGEGEPATSLVEGMGVEVEDSAPRGTAAPGVPDEAPADEASSRGTILQLEPEEAAAAHLEVPSASQEDSVGSSAVADLELDQVGKGTEPAGIEVSLPEGGWGDSTVSAVAEGWEAIEAGAWDAGPPAGFADPVAPAAAAEAAGPPETGLDAVVAGEERAVPEPEEEPAPWMRDAEPVPSAELEPVPALEAGMGTAAEGEPDVVVVEGAAEEAELEEPDAGLAVEPELVITETMAEIFLRQGHKPLALAVYAQLAERDPGNPRLAAAMSRLKEELSPPAPSATYAAAETGGESVGSFLARVLAVEPPPQAPGFPPPAIEPATAGAPTRPAAESLSLSAIFGEEPGRAPVLTAPAGVAEAEESGPSFDEFFGGLAEGPGGRGAAAGGSEEDLEQFNAWLRGLKR